MKRHKNWQEWGRKRAQQFQMQRHLDVIYTDVNAVVERMYERDPVWKFVQNPGPVSFHSGREMRIPFQFDSKQAEGMQS